MADEIYPCYVKVGEEAGDFVELPTEHDGTMLLNTVASQFPGAVGLRFKSDTGTWRGVRLSDDDILVAPLDGWGDVAYHVVIPAKASKRKIEEDEDESPLEKMGRMTEKEILSDIVVLNMPFEANEADIRAHFEQFGDLEMVEIKYDKNRKSRGFGFIRYNTVEAVKAVFEATHILEGRELEVNFPKDKTKDDGTPTKLFIGRLPKGLKEDELREYFEKFGDLKDAYIPTPFRGFGFVTYKKQSAARKVLTSTHVIKGQYINVSYPSRKKDDMENANSGNPGYLGNQGFGNQVYGNMSGMPGGILGGMQRMFPRGMPPSGPRGPMGSMGSMESYYGLGFQGNKNFGSGWYNQKGGKVSN